MSDQANPAEIEDVLSSIRRLVAGGAKSASERQDGAADPDTTPEAEDDSALVLTPSHRIGEDSPEAADPHHEWEDDAAADRAEADELSDDEIAIEREISDDEGAEAVLSLSEALASDDPEQAETDDFEAATGEGGETGDDAKGDDAEGDGPALEFEHRKSPFLSETLMAKRAAERTAPPRTEEAPRTGFGFGAARRDDPVRHVPLSEIARGADTAGPAYTGPGHDRGLTLDMPAGDIADGAADDSEADAPVEASQDDLGQSAPASSRPFTPSLEATTSPDTAVAAANEVPFEEAGALTPATAEGAGLEGGDGPDADMPDAESAELGDNLSGEETLEGVVGDDADAIDAASEMESDSDAAVAPSMTQAPEAALSEDALLEHVMADAEHIAPPPDADDDPAFGSGAEAVAQDPGQPGEMDFPEDEALDAPKGSSPEKDGPTSPEQGLASGTGSASSDRLNVFGSDPAVLDEEALRALVADVVHGELQGALGERVSHNIRQLVRREIARALEDRGLT
ncbi:MAG: hypothetical protein AAGG09_06175 [Pseudomonadota bacterium]